jgi:hypothetical protein
MGRYVRINVTGMNRYSNALYYTSIAEAKVTRLEVLDGGFVLHLTDTAEEFDVNTGSAASYDIRWSTDDITNNTQFNAATAVPGPLPAPQPFGFPESLSVSGFGQEEVLYVAMKATDENGNVSVLSNSTKVATPGTPPGQVVGLAIGGATGSSLTLTFTASADDGGSPGSGPVDHYDVRCSTTPINGMGDFLLAPTFGGPVPAAPGNPQTPRPGLEPPGSVHGGLASRVLRQRLLREGEQWVLRGQCRRYQPVHHVDVAGRHDESGPVDHSGSRLHPEHR